MAYPLSRTSKTTMGSKVQTLKEGIENMLKNKKL
jgi:hypothetical protein